MNIFVLDRDPKTAAEFHSDVHAAGKLLVEAAQLLCVTHHVVGSQIQIPYRKTHANHPCAVWVRESIDNYRWLCQLGLALCEQYRLRFGIKRAMKGGSPEHASKAVIEWAIQNEPVLPQVGLTPFKQCMPDEFKREDAVAAYRAYYRGAKAEMSEWSNGKPYWF